MNDQQLESVLRRSLAQHAGTVDSGPQWPLDDDVLAQRPGRRPVAWWPLAAAIVAVLVVLGVVAAIRHMTSDHHRPATPVIVTRTACLQTQLPEPWRNTIEASTLGLNVALLGGGPDGAVVVQRHVGAMLQTALIEPNGTDRVLLSQPFDGRYMSASVAMDTKWILVPIIDRQTPQHKAAKFEVIGRDTLQLAREVPATVGIDTVMPALFGDHVYWSPGGALVAYDMAAGTLRTTISSGVQELQGTSIGVAWLDAQHRSHLVAGQSPDQVPGVPAVHPDLVTDGQHYAWLGSSAIVWYDEPTKQTVVVKGFPAPGIEVTVRGVAGPYVIVQDRAGGTFNWIVDTRTGVVGSDPNYLDAYGQHILSSFSPLVGMVILHLDRVPPLTC